MDEIFGMNARQGFEAAREAAPETIICPKHGAHEVGHFWNGKEVKPKPCPDCQAEKEVEQKRIEAEEREQQAVEAKRKKLERAIDQANIPERFAGRTLDRYVVVNEEAGKALKVARAYADGFERVIQKGTSLMFLGKPGTGKTHLAIGIAHEIIKRDYYPLFITVAGMVRYVKESWSRSEERTETESIAEFVLPDLLILDEVGVQFGSDTEKLILFEIMNKRYEKMKPTIVLSNLDAKGLALSLGERVVDRLREDGGRAVLFPWGSYRG